MQQIVPNFWFDGQAEAAAEFYAAAFQNAKVLRVDRYTDAGKEIHGHDAGDVMTVEFEVEGQRFIALNGGPQFKVTPAISFFVHCKSPEEVDTLWQNLSPDASILMDVGEYPFSKRYGWLSDKFGVNWQIMLTESEVSQKIVTSLMFTQNVAGKAEEAMNFYASVFPQSAVGMISRYGADQAPDTEGTVMYGEFTLLGQKLAAMDSAQDHEFTFTEGTSLLVECKTEEEVGSYWEALSAVPESEACGWLKDKYGVSWQIVPSVLSEMLREGTQEQVERVTAAFMKMKKLDMVALQTAYDQE